MTGEQRPKEDVLPRQRGSRGFWSRSLTDDDYLARIYGRSIVDENGCIRWQGYKNTRGYGETHRYNKREAVHRIVYRIKVGPIPPGMLVCHTCDVRDCCNHEHLFLGTNKDNNMDCARKGRHQEQQKTHCPQGHPYDEANTYITKRGLRNCRACARERHRRRAKERKQ